MTDRSQIEAQEMSGNNNINNPYQPAFTTNDSTASNNNNGNNGKPTARFDGKPQVRKRTSRACDQCNQLRTKCDGLQPCAHCVSFGLECVYLRVPQKRGKASQTYLESTKKAKESGSTKATKPPNTDNNNNNASTSATTPSNAIPVTVINNGVVPGTAASVSTSSGDSPLPSLTHYTTYPTVSPLPGTQSNDEANQNNRSRADIPNFASGSPNMDMASPFKLQASAKTGEETTENNDNSSNSSNNTNNNNGNENPTNNNGDHLSLFSSLLDNSPSTFFDPQPSRTPPTGQWFRSNQATSTTAMAYNNNSNNSNERSLYDFSGAYVPNQLNNNELDQTKSSPESLSSIGNQKYNPLKYPVLRPVIDTLLSEGIPLDLAFELLETYFSHSTHVLAYLVRESSILSETNPRKTDDVLIYAILLVAAHHSDHPTIAGAPSSRQSYISKLTRLTTSHLTTAGSITAAGSLDEVIAYVQLGTVVSASEYKGSSVRWWSTAIALAKELKLNHEIESLPAEIREERRRTWWLLYMVDRHLGLCYNRPLIILDLESADLYQPAAEEVWQSGMALTPPEIEPNRTKGISYSVNGQGIYGYFLPLMSILGSLLDYHHMDQSVMLPFKDISDQLRATIQQYLDYYMTSLSNWNHMPCQRSYENSWRDYAWHLSHVLYVLSSVPWDPTELLQNPDKFISHQDYGKIVNHAISGTKAIRRIFTTDPGLRLMPFFFGIYLLQGSFVLLAVVDRVESEAPQELVAACETIVHAHEVCIATLDTEYQRNFRRVMRGTMSLLSATSDKTPPGISPISPSNPLGMQNNEPSSSATTSLATVSKAEKDEARKRRQYILSLYRWNRGGHGLAV